MDSRRRATVLLAVRTGLLLAATAAVAGAFALAQRRVRLAEQATQAYACPMHPEVRDTRASACPICGMALVVRDRRPAVPASARGAVTTLGVSEAIVAPAWSDGDGLVALLYNDDAAALAPGEGAIFRAAPRLDRPTPPALRVTLAPRTQVGPAWDHATAPVRFVWATGAPPAQGTHGWIEIAARTRQIAVLPYGALVPAPAGPHAIALSPDGALEQRPLAVGRVHFDFVSVLGPPRPGEILVTEGAALYEAERRLGLAPPTEAAP